MATTDASEVFVNSLGNTFSNMGIAVVVVIIGGAIIVAIIWILRGQQSQGSQGY